MQIVKQQGQILVVQNFSYHCHIITFWTSCITSATQSGYYHFPWYSAYILCLLYLSCFAMTRIVESSELSSILHCQHATILRKKGIESNSTLRFTQPLQSEPITSYCSSTNHGFIIKVKKTTHLLCRMRNASV